MASSFICGFEMGTVNEAEVPPAVGATLVVQSAIVHSGGFALHSKGTGSTGAEVIFIERAAGGTARNLFYSVRFYMQVAALPVTTGNGIVFLIIGAVSPIASVLAINSSGQLILGVSTGGGGTNSGTNVLSADGKWHLIQVQTISASSRKVFVDGVLWITDSTTGGAASAVNQLQLGPVGPPTDNTIENYFDDILADDSSTVVTDGRSLLLLPISDNARVGWTAGAGGTTNLFNAVKNVPPVGLASGSETNTSQVKDAASSTTDNYDANVQSYTTAGILASATINAVMPICVHGEESTGAVKSGDIRVISNPSDGGADGTRYDFGDASVVVGTYPTGWSGGGNTVSGAGAVTSNPAVTLGNSPVVRVGKRTASAQVVDVCFMGLYVDFTPASTAKTGDGFKVFWMG